jgi:hypothetical protein
LCITVFGDEFRAAVGDLRVLALAAFGIMAVKMLSGALLAQRKALLASAAFAVTVVPSPVLISWDGDTGAALARTIAFTAGGTAAGILFVRFFHGHAGDLPPRGADLSFLVGKLRGRVSRAA